MADIDSDDDPDSAAMAEAMGFTGFGMQRTARKRKLTPPSQTGANNAPLGKRRPLNLPQPVVSGAGGDDDGGGNPEEIDLDDDEGDVGVGNAAGEEVDGGDAGAAAPLSALTVSDVLPTSSPQHHHSLPPRPPQQQQQQSHHGGNNAMRRPGGRPGGGPGKAPWWEGEWDPRLVARMIENPWERLEKQRGLGALGTWPPTARGMAAAQGQGEGDVSSSSGGAVVVEQTAAQVTVS